MEKLFKLSSGEEIIASVVDEDAQVYNLKNPLALMLEPQEDGRVAMRMIPLSFFCKESKLALSKSHVVFTGIPEDDLRNNYAEKFGGIVKASTLPAGGGIQIAR